MPNHIANILDIIGNKRSVNAFCNKIYKLVTNDESEQDYVFDFGATVPFPKELEETTAPPQNEAEKELQNKLAAKYGAGNWFDWKRKFWGTKWGAYDVEPVEEIKGGLRFKFNTAWAAPFAWLRTTAALYPHLIIVDSWKDEGGGSGRIRLSHEDGNLEESLEELLDHDWLIEFDEYYREEYEFITKGDYDEVVERYQKDLETPYNSLIKYLLNRLKDEDLPLFVNFNWYGNLKDFEERLKSN